MRRFEIFAGATLIGVSDLECGDAPMGVASGKFLPTPAYTAIQRTVIAARNGPQAHLALEVRTLDGFLLPAQGGTQIIDYSPELGPEGIEVHVCGIGYPLYAELFPEHVQAYRTHQFPKAK